MGTKPPTNGDRAPAGAPRVQAIAAPPAAGALSVVEVARRLPGSRGAGHCSRATIVRWVVRGVRVGDARVYLPAVRRGGNWFVEEAALAAFLAATTAGGGAPPEPGRTPAQRRRDSDHADRTLAAAGW